MLIRASASTRRDFLRTSAAAAAAFPVSQLLERAAERTPAPAAKKILILGGTSFLGPAVVEAALARGHKLTLFNRGRTNPQLFPEVEKLQGNRRRPAREGAPPQNLEALKGRQWDAVVDTSGYFTGEVEDAAKLLAPNVEQYVFISSLSVYRDMEKNDREITEDSPLSECQDKYTFDMGKEYENYGALKGYCEQAAAAAFPGRATLVRPGYIVGPRDNSDRFPYWPLRIARGGDVLAPGDPDAEQQLVDVRDLGAWIVRLCEEKVVGPFNAVGYKGHISTAELLYTAKGTLNHECTFTWVDDEFLKQRGVTSWQEMPCWTPKTMFNHARNEKAIAAGLTFRPVAETIRDTHAWAHAERGDRPWRAGMKPEREAELLAAWRARAK
jgi:2'-hydroxyisoflavone reductase